MNMLHGPTGWPQRMTSQVLLPKRLFRATSPEALNAERCYGFIDN